MTAEAVHTLNARQEAFCQSYARSGNATQSAKDAGYSQKTAYSQGFDLLKKPEIISRIETIRTERFKKVHMGPDETLALLAKQARFTLDGLVKVGPDGAPVVDLENATKDQLDALTEASLSEAGVLKLKGPNVLGALTALAKIQGLMKEKVEVTMDSSFAEIMAAAQARAASARREESDD